jgi:polyphosphate glucokinase
VATRPCWKRWGSEFNELLTLYETYLWPDLIILGGGMAEKFAKYRRFLKTSAPLVPAAMGNTAGIVGAARLGANAARASGATQNLVRAGGPGLD